MIIVHLFKKLNPVVSVDLAKKWTCDHKQSAVVPSKYYGSFIGLEKN